MKARNILLALALAAVLSLLTCVGLGTWLVHSEIEALVEGPLPSERVVLNVDAADGLSTAAERRGELDELLDVEEHNRGGPPGWGIIATWSGRTIYTCSTSPLVEASRTGVGGWVVEGVPTFDPQVVAPIRGAGDPFWIVADVAGDRREAFVQLAAGRVEATLSADGSTAMCRLVPPAEASPMALGDPEAAREALERVRDENVALRETLGVSNEAIQRELEASP